MSVYRFRLFLIPLLLATAGLGLTGCQDNGGRDVAPVSLTRQTSELEYRSERGASGALFAYFFDVGQGDATLLAGPDFTILIDAGRHSRSDVVPYLLNAGIEKIDLLVGTHPHADHIGQFPDVLRSFPVTEVWMSGDEHTSQTYERALDAVLASGAGYHEPRAGEVIEIGSARIEVLHPREINGNLHDGCVALRLLFGEMAFMLTGDAETRAEEQILQSGQRIRSQILKLGHHGSHTSTSEDFLWAVRPEVAIYSAGAGNSYGHPHAEVIQRVLDNGVQVYGTDRDGTIVVVTDGHRYEVRPLRSLDQIAQVEGTAEARRSESRQRSVSR